MARTKSERGATYGCRAISPSTQPNENVALGEIIEQAKYIFPEKKRQTSEEKAKNLEETRKDVDEWDPLTLISMEGTKEEIIIKENKRRNGY